MYLINCQDYSLEFFFNPNKVDYLILSHTWGDGEVTLKDMENLGRAREKSGFRKIEGICDMARRDGIRYAWVDTCCIDKTSSTDLSEAINSMFYWYQQAVRCIAYIEDLRPVEANPMATMGEISRCRWFTRGWTLQELIAPKDVRFVDQGWNYRGDKSLLAESLSRITGIHAEVLDGTRPLSQVAVAQKMSWAAGRETTRVEDTAYCLLGIFDINMPLLYGERNKAFLRLQEAIILQTGDLSIFAWTSTKPAISTLSDSVFIQNAKTTGSFAGSPLYFAGCQTMELTTSLPNPSITITNAGVLFSAGVARIPGSNTELLHLHCKRAPDPTCADEPSVVVAEAHRGPGGYILLPFEEINQQLHKLSFRNTVNICLASAKVVSDYVTNRTMGQGCQLVVQLQDDEGLLLPEVGHYPKHSWGSNAFEASNISQGFLGVVEIRTLGSTPGSGVQREFKCWVLCGVSAPVASEAQRSGRDVVPAGAWVTILTEDETPLDTSTLEDPYTMLDFAADNLKRYQGGAGIVAKAVVPRGTGVLQIEAEISRDDDEYAEGWSFFGHVTISARRI